MYNIVYLVFFFFNDTATTEIYTLSLHDALPILTKYVASNSLTKHEWNNSVFLKGDVANEIKKLKEQDRKSTRLNSSHANISYAVFCLKKKKQQNSFILNY